MPPVYEPEPYEAPFSRTSIIVGVAENAGDEGVSELFAEEGLEVIYDYENFGMYALRLPREMSGAEIDALIARLSADERVLFAEKDYIVSLD